MDLVRIKSLCESDVDEIIRNAGGRRLLQDGLADYQLNEAYIDLKLLEEEGLNKETRRKKVAELFMKRYGDRPVIIIDPCSLDELGQRDYYNILSGPIKTHLKKAAKQLEITTKTCSQPGVRVLLMVNIGYTALLHKEFEAVCVKCAQNDTSKIDWLVCAGIYYYGDGFDYYLTTRFEAIPINLNRGFPSYSLLLESWNFQIEKLMADYLGRGVALETGKLPVVDIAFDHNGVRFVRIAPELPPSNYWPDGKRPRNNSREGEPRRPFARSFPALTAQDWIRFRHSFSNLVRLKSNHQEWQKLQIAEEERLQQERCPFVPVVVRFEGFEKSIGLPVSEWHFRHLCSFANAALNAKVHDLLSNLTDEGASSVLPCEYIHVLVQEIGYDKGNDLCTIRHVSEWPGFRRNEIVVQNLRAYWEEAVCLAACYAVKREVRHVIYRKTSTAIGGVI
jgi:hypothetical protein